ncbi:hypothetical protein ACFVWR_06820 [Leifsonia sp. NPDC058292]|uniref:hypothetical protein n=1 Tax=Leifsonia sp. NPDC058292 TaxID=3346428 RepID=UPI0036D98722
MKNFSKTVAALTLGAATVVALAGCAGSTPVKAAAASHTATPTRSASPSPSVGPLEDGLTWKSGLKMVGDAGGGYFATFMNPLMNDAGWAEIPERTDWNGGKWAYKSTTTSCEISFFQGSVSGVTIVPGDDRASTVNALKALYGDVYPVVESSVTDVSLRYGMSGPIKPGDPVVDMLSATGTAPDFGMVVWARVFSSIGQTTYLSGQCESPEELATVTTAFTRFGMLGY